MTKITNFFKKIKPNTKTENMAKKSKSGLNEQFSFDIAATCESPVENSNKKILRVSRSLFKTNNQKKRQLSCVDLQSYKINNDDLNIQVRKNPPLQLEPFLETTNTPKLDLFNFLFS